MSTVESLEEGASFLTGGGAVGALCRAKSWTDTSLGEPHLWPQSLRTVVRIVLSSRYQMWMGWGPDLAFFYNDAYRPTLGVKHEWALGAPAREVWKEIWPDIGPRIERVLSSGEATWDEGLLLLLERSGYAEETYHTFSYSPLANDADQVVGMLCVVTEETERIIAARRLACVRDLAAEVPRNNTRAEVLKAAQRQLNQALKDLPFTLLYLFEDVGHGTGLGLSQVYGFVKQSGGHVKIYSELGSGTTVKIYLPRLYAAESSAAAEIVPKVARGSAKEIILAVEDDPDVRRQTTGALRELGYQVLEASNGKEALEILATQPHVDLLFTDVGLPGGMNGRQLSEAALKLRRKLKVLFTTGYARNAIVHDGRLDPGVQLITKPFTFAGLSQKLRDMLDANSSATRILIVEDEDLIQMVIANHVEEIGFEVEIAGSAAEAKNKMLLLNGSIDAAIIDMGLPDARGDDLVSELRAIYPALPVVISSGYDRAAMHIKFASMKNIEFLTKPYTQLELHDALSRLGVAD